MFHTSLVHNRISVLWPVSVERGREQQYPLFPLSPAVCSHNGPHCLMLDTKWVQLLQVIDWRCTAQLPLSTWPPEFWCGEFHKPSTPSREHLLKLEVALKTFHLQHLPFDIYFLILEKRYNSMLSFKRATYQVSSQYEIGWVDRNDDKKCVCRSLASLHMVSLVSTACWWIKLLQLPPQNCTLAFLRY